jgi:hypothetical protein
MPTERPPLLGEVVPTFADNYYYLIILYYQYVHCAVSVIGIELLTWHINNKELN